VIDTAQIQDKSCNFGSMTRQKALPDRSKELAW